MHKHHHHRANIQIRCTDSSHRTKRMSRFQNSRTHSKTLRYLMKKSCSKNSRYCSVKQHSIAIHCFLVLRKKRNWKKNYATKQTNRGKAEEAPERERVQAQVLVLEPVRELALVPEGLHVARVQGLELGQARVLVQGQELAEQERGQAREPDRSRELAREQEEQPDPGE